MNQNARASVLREFNQPLSLEHYPLPDQAEPGRIGRYTRASDFAKLPLTSIGKSIGQNDCALAMATPV